MTGRFGETKGPLAAWLFFTMYMALYILVRRLLQIPTTLTWETLLVESVEVYGVLLAFLVVFVGLKEKHRSIRNMFSSLGFKQKGTAQSVSWSFSLFPLFIIIGLVSMTLSNYAGSLSSLGVLVLSNGQFPWWYRYYLIVYSFFPIAVVEEMFARGYVLDRLMPEHPSSLRRALPAIVLSSVLFTIWHLPSYTAGYEVSGLQIAVLLAGNVFPLSVFLGVAYVRAQSRNIVGPVLVHFLLDAIPVFITLV